VSASNHDPAKGTNGNPRGDGDLTDLLSELRILLPGSQTLVAFLIILPFNNRFTEIQDEEKWVYVVTFVCAVVSLACFTAPAVHHRLQRPLRDREAFKNKATKWIIAGLAALSVALILATQLVLSTVILDAWLAWLAAGGIAVLLVAIWWLPSMLNRDRMTGESDPEA
jgi:magnesium-transporting ATPase (P-type)